VFTGVLTHTPEPRSHTLKLIETTRLFVTDQTSMSHSAIFNM
jgi:hypothetical protein